MYVDLDSNICIDSHFGDTSDTSDFKSDELLDSIAKSCSIDPPEKVCPYVQPAEVTREKPFTADDVQTELNIQQETGAKLVSEIEKLSIVVSDLKAETLKLESQKMDKRKAAHAEAAKEKSEKFDCLKQLKAFSLKQ